MSKIDPLADIAILGGALTSNNDKIEAAFENTLSRDGSAPNSMQANIDVNGYRILNLPTAVSDSEPVTLGQAGSIAGVTSPLTRESVGAVFYPQTAAETTAGVTPTNYYVEPLNAARYGAAGDGVTDDSSALANLVAVAKEETMPRIVIPSGTYAITTNTLTFDLPNGSTIDCYGEITSTVTGAAAVIIGDASSNTYYLTVRGLNVSRTTADTSASSVGIQIRNIVWSKIDIRRVTNFQDGVHVYSDQPNGGVSYCEFSLGFLHDNKRNLYLSAASTGYVNENNFFGGSFNHSTGYPAVATVNLEVEHFVTNQLNNNRFWGPSFEDNDGTNAVAAVINGSNNVIYWPRMERTNNQSTYEIQFTANSSECAVVGHGFTMVNTNIADSGASNMYETREGLVISHQTAADAAKSVLKLQSTSSSSARLLQLLDTGGTEQGYLDGSGNAVMKRLRATAAGAGVASTVTFGNETQATVGAAGGASALPATPTGYLRFFVGTTEYVIPYYAQA